MQTLTWSPDLRKNVQFSFKKPNLVESGKNLSSVEQRAFDSLVVNQSKAANSTVGTQVYWS
jgi:hypothetical protein